MFTCGVVSQSQGAREGAEVEEDPLRSQSLRAFWKYMVQKIADVGMKQPNLDPCLFVGEKVICICYVDDLLFWARDESDTDAESDAHPGDEWSAAGAYGEA